MLNDLISKLETVTEGSRELDAAIDKCLYGFSDDWIEYETGKWRHKVTGDLTYAVNYTTSIDAALTLVPEGWVWSLMPVAHTGAPWFVAGVREHMNNMPVLVSGCDGHSPSPALALCIAALKACG